MGEYKNEPIWIRAMAGLKKRADDGMLDDALEWVTDKTKGLTEPGGLLHEPLMHDDVSSEDSATTQYKKLILGHLAGWGASEYEKVFNAIKDSATMHDVDASIPDLERSEAIDDARDEWVKMHPEFMDKYKQAFRDALMQVESMVFDREHAAERLKSVEHLIEPAETPSGLDWAIQQEFNTGDHVKNRVFDRAWEIATEGY